MRESRGLWLSLALLCGAPAAADDLAQPLADAQAALAAGEYDKAYPLYLAAAQGGNPLAQFTVATFHDAGWGSARADRAVACDWFGRAAQGGIPAAAHAHARCLAEGGDAAAAAHWYGRAAELGHYLSLCDLADLHMGGQGVEKDPRKGLGLCRQAAELGSIPASLRVARYLLEGDPAIRDPAAAHAWFESVSHLPEAQYYLGLIHRDGLAGEASADEARLWFERAASQGYVPAYFPTARLYFTVSPDLQRTKPPADILAKSYMWLTATLRRSGDAAERAQAEAMLQEVLAIMPPTWIGTLDERVAQHLADHPAIR